MSNPGPITNIAAPAPAARSRPIFTFGMLIVIVLIHLYLTSIKPGDRLFALFSYALVPALIDPGKLSADMLIRFVSHAFLHANWTHVLANSYALILFGLLAERFLGTVRVAFVYLLSAIGGGLLYYALNEFSQAPLVGASGAISGLFGAAIIAAPQSSRRALISNAVIWLGLNVGLPALASQSGGRIAWEAHLGGFAVGLLMGWILRASMPRAVITNPPSGATMSSTSTASSPAGSSASQAGAKKPEPFNPVQRR